MIAVRVSCPAVYPWRRGYLCGAPVTVTVWDDETYAIDDCSGCGRSATDEDWSAAIIALAEQAAGTLDGQPDDPDAPWSGGFCENH